nr:hypothetical protein BaRGS_026462 [Batillaria attramentaria]
MTVDGKGNWTLVWRKCLNEALPADVYIASLSIRYVVPKDVTGFKMLFSFHPMRETPRKLKSGLFDCSASHYASFRQHLDCNLEVECQGREDEGEHCPFSPPGCNGLAGYKDKCYSLASPEKPVSWQEAVRRCREDGGNLAMMKTEGEWEAFRDIFRHDESDYCLPVYVRCNGVYDCAGHEDETYHGDFVSYEKSWLTNTACIVAGFVWLVSSVVSVLTISLITLDRERYPRYRD